LGLIEVVTISRTIAIKSRQSLSSNKEFMGLGLSNMIGGFFSSYAGSGSFTRSALNYELGAKTPMSSMFASLILAAIVLFITPLAEHLPIPTIGGIILIIAFKLIDFKSIFQISKASKSEIAVLTITFLSTLLFDLQFAILVGVFFSLSFYLMRTTTPAVIPIAPNPVNTRRKFMNAKVNALDECPQLLIVRIDGSLFFGAIEHIKNKLLALRDSRKKILIVCSGINFVDVAGAEFLAQEAESNRIEGGVLYLCSMKKKVRDFLARGYTERIGLENIFTNKEAAISAIYENLDRPTCEACPVKIFMECPK
jgi:SulP family sulfate permease